MNSRIKNILIKSGNQILKKGEYTNGSKTNKTDMKKTSNPVPDLIPGLVDATTKIQSPLASPHMDF